MNRTFSQLVRFALCLCEREANLFPLICRDTISPSKNTINTARLGSTKDRSILALSTGKMMPPTLCDG
jgi:hypothetical protein